MRPWKKPGILDRLTTLWTVEHQSLAAIAHVLSREFGVAITKNAVTGKLDRLGLMGEGGHYRRPDRGRIVQHRRVSAGISLPGGRVFRDGVVVEGARS